MVKKIVYMLSVVSITLLIGSCSQENPVKTSVETNGENLKVATIYNHGEIAAALDKDRWLFIFERNVWGEIFFTDNKYLNSPWQNKGGEFKGNIVLEKDNNNKLCAFAVGTDNVIKYIKQETTNRAWSSWTSLPAGYGILTGKLAVTTFGNGTSKRIMVFFLAGDNQLYYSLQNSSGGFSNGHLLHKDEIGFATPQIAAYKNSQGNVEIVASDINGKLYRKFYDGYFSKWSPLSAPSGYTGEIAMTSNRDGRLEVFACNPGSHCYGHSYEYTPASSNWSNWEVLSQSSDYTCTNVSVETNEDGRLETFFNGLNGKLMHQYQSAPNSYWLAASFFENGQPATNRHIAAIPLGSDFPGYTDNRLSVFMFPIDQPYIFFSNQHCVNCYWEQFRQFRY